MRAGMSTFLFFSTITNLLLCDAPICDGHLEKSVPMIYFCDSTAKKNEIGAANRIPDADFMYLSGLEAPKLRVFPAKGYSYPTVISFRRKTE